MVKKDLRIKSENYQEEEEDKSCKNSLFFGLFDDSESTRLRSGSMKRQYSDMGDSYHRVMDDDVYDDDDGEGSKMDMRVLMVLEYMRELYVRQLQILKKMFPGGAKDEFLGFFNNIGNALSEFKQDSSTGPVMKRSLSTGSRRVTMRGVNLGLEEFRDERFKVTTVDAGGGGAGGGGGGGGAAGGGGGAVGGTSAGQGQTKK